MESSSAFSWRNFLSPAASQRRFSSPEVVSQKPPLQGFSTADDAVDPTCSPSERSLVPSKASTTSISTQQQQHPQRARCTIPGPIPDPEKERRPSLLFRILHTARRQQRSQQSASGGSTASRTTSDDEMFESSTIETPPRHPIARLRRATIDNAGDTPDRGSSGPLHSRVDGQKSTDQFKDKQRRSTSMDFSFPHHATRRYSRNILTEEEYEDAQERLQRRANDHAKGGNKEQAIEVWREALQLAEEQQASLAAKTELMCALMDLHMQLAQAPAEESDMRPDDFHRRSLYHKQAAKRYLRRIKPALVEPTWWVASNEIVDFMVEAQAWELALQTAEQLLKQAGEEPTHVANGHVPTIFRMATLHFQVARKKLDLKRQGEALQHLQEASRYMQQQKRGKQLSPSHRDMYLEILHCLATEYAGQEQHTLALKSFHEQLKYISPNDREKLAFVHCQIATEVYIPLLKLDMALEQLQLAMNLIRQQYKQNHESCATGLNMESAHTDNDSTNRIHLQVLQTKADVLFKLGKFEQSLNTYEKALRRIETVNASKCESDTSPKPGSSLAADKAKILFSMGRLCVKLGHVRRGIFYFTLELEITHAELGNHLSVSRVLHELARLYDEGLGDYRMSLQKYKEAFRVEYAVMQQCASAIEKCSRCSRNRRSGRKSGVPRACCVHANLQRDCAQQMRETKKCEGRILFKLGDFERALQTTLPGHTTPARVGVHGQ